MALGVGGTSAVFSVVYSVLLQPLPYRDSDRPVRLWKVHRGARVTPSLFRVLRVAAADGRLFEEADAEQGASKVVVLTHATWRSRFEGAPVLDTWLTVNGEPHRIVGIALRISASVSQPRLHARPDRDHGAARRVGADRGGIGARRGGSRPGDACDSCLSHEAVSITH